MRCLWNTLHNLSFHGSELPSCEAQFDQADDKKKGLERDVSDANNAIEVSKESIATLTEEIAALTAGIKALDNEVADATEQRKEENTEYKDLIASDTTAKEILGFAKNRLNKFYKHPVHICKLTCTFICKYLSFICAISFVDIYFPT